MSVDFTVRGRKDLQHLTVNLANTNARMMLEWLGVSNAEDLYGSMRAAEFSALCRRRLWDEERNDTPAVPTRVESTPWCATVVTCGRDANYNKTRAASLLALAHAADPNELIGWG